VKADDIVNYYSDLERQGKVKVENNPITKGMSNLVQKSGNGEAFEG